MPHAFFTDRRPQQGLTFEEYLSVTRERTDQDVDDLPIEEADRIEYTKLNLHRTQRIVRTYRVAEELDALLRAVDRSQLWMVLTEPWCSDSSQCLPIIAGMAACSESIELRILLRDDNLDVMDLYLTDGKRGVPLLVAFDSAGEEIFRWGPRPRPAQAVFEKAKAAGLEKPELLAKMHLFYGQDRGRSVETEFVELLTRNRG
jgi:hypothetical protein